MQAYSAFRLESDIKEGGKDGLYKADLTSKDVFYTKDEFETGFRNQGYTSGYCTGDRYAGTFSCFDKGKTGSASRYIRKRQRSSCAERKI